MKPPRKSAAVIFALAHASISVCTSYTNGESTQATLRPERTVTSGDKALEHHAFYIFNSVHHLLRQWGNTISPNGFSFTRGTIPAGTNLYHARIDANTPSSPDWLAFDPEMSYGILANTCNTFLRTYRSARPLNILYIDGNSAALTATGTLDSQDILMYGYVKPRKPFFFDEYERAATLCAWGKPRGIDGFVRQNSGFELIKCAFEDGLTLLKNLNVTGWIESFDSDSGNNTTRPCFDQWPPKGNDTRSGLTSQELNVQELMHARVDGPRFLPSLPDRGPNRKGDHPGLPLDRYNTPPSGPPTRQPTRPGKGDNPFAFISPFQNQILFEWARTAAAVYNGPGEYRVKLDVGTFVTAYGRPGSKGINSANTTDHRLVNMTREAAADLKRDIEAFFPQVSSSVAPQEPGKRVQRPTPLSADNVDEGAESRLSGFNWRDVTDQIVARYGDRLPELFSYLNIAADAGTNANDTKFGFESARMLVSLLLVPHYDLSPVVSRDENIRLCTEFLAPDPYSVANKRPQLYASERVIVQSIKRTHRTICETLFFVHDELSQVSAIGKGKHLAILKRAAAISRDHVSELMNDLQWTSWKSCDRKCGYNEICVITLWPLTGFEFTNPDPTCADATNWLEGWERRRPGRPPR